MNETPKTSACVNVPAAPQGASAKSRRGFFRRLLGDERGASAVEYTILLVVISAGMIAVWQAFGNEIAVKIRAQTEAVTGMTTHGR